MKILDLLDSIKSCLNMPKFMLLKFPSGVVKLCDKGDWPMRKAILILSSLFLLVLFLSDISEARGRRGSHRVGGYNSHGKGSHYWGGW